MIQTIKKTNIFKIVLIAFIKIFCLNYMLLKFKNFLIDMHNLNYICISIK